MAAQPPVLSYLTEYGFYFICGMFGGTASCIYSHSGQPILKTFLNILASGFVGLGAGMATYAIDMHVNIRGSMSFVFGSFGKKGMMILGKVAENHFPTSNEEEKEVVNPKPVRNAFMEYMNSAPESGPSKAAVELLISLLKDGKITPEEYEQLRVGNQNTLRELIHEEVLSANQALTILQVKPLNNGVC